MISRSGGRPQYGPGRPRSAAYRSACFLRSSCRPTRWLIVALNTLIQRRTPGPLLGRVAAASEALISGPQAVSIGMGAVLVGVLDYRLLFLAMGAGMAAVAAFLWLGRWLSPAAKPGLPVPATAAITAAPVSAANDPVS
jgi:hypothetical protein